MFKKLSVFLSLLMIICMLSVGTAVMAAVEEVGMNFDEDGTAGLNIEAYAGIFDNPAYFLDPISGKCSRQRGCRSVSGYQRVFLNEK